MEGSATTRRNGDNKGTILAFNYSCRCAHENYGWRKKWVFKKYNGLC